MQVLGKIATLWQVPFYLGRSAGQAHHINVFCDAEGVPYTPARLAEAGITENDIAELFQAEARHIADLLDKPVEQIGLRLTAGEPPAIIDYKKMPKFV